jgi:murein L,D-transpeptidase YafK
MRYLILVCAVMFFQTSSFKETQLKNSRVKTAFDEKEAVVDAYFTEKGLEFNGFSMFIRGFKKERKLEVWIREKNKTTFSLLQTYDFCSSSGILGPKRKEGDLQIPEGVYHINHFNPQSNFLLSLGVSYPNVSDKILSDKKYPGGAIYIHGNCVTVGCIPITDDKIKELYVLAVEARNNGQKEIPIHIFPTKLDDASMSSLQKENAEHLSFWRNLQPIYRDFETTRKLKPTSVNKKGEYLLN